MHVTSAAWENRWGHDAAFTTPGDDDGVGVAVVEGVALGEGETGEEDDAELADV
jgi:hypothetical protein